MANFSSEEEMSNCFKKILQKYQKRFNFKFEKEVEGLWGVPDFILYDENLDKTIAIELKLKNWGRALTQAFKYRAFSHCSFVIIDKDFVHRAKNNIDQFIHYNIGLASFNKKGKIKKIYEPQFTSPYSKFTLFKLRQVLHE